MIDMNSKKKITLTPIKKDDHRFLFELLEQRQLFANISHKKMPTWDEHVEFVKSKPYLKWYVVVHKDNKVGSIYLSKQHEIGIHIFKKYEKESIQIESIKQLMSLNSKIKFRANVSPKNKKYITLFKKLGFEMIQHTYELDLRTSF
jgi:RimJ/RimL family protein N-acetyltransferase